MKAFLRDSYYHIKPFLPTWLLIALRRKRFNHQFHKYRDIWPINEKAGHPPPGWNGWPDGKRFALVLTHDVEGHSGQKKCLPLAELEINLGFRSSFNFAAEEYEQDASLKRYLVENGFEIGLHGLIHSGNIFRSREHFLKQLPRINSYLKNWKAVGFRAPAMYHNLEWMHELEIDYDTSTFDTDPFEPQPDGVDTIFPFWVKNNQGKKGYVELPYTLPQDFSLFILKQEKDNGIWQKKLDWIAQRGGMALFIAHPDYMNFDGAKPAIDEYPADYYRGFLTYIKENYKDQYWHVLPKEMASFWAQNYIPKQEAAISSTTVIASKAKQPHLLTKPTDEVTEIDPLKDPRWDTFVGNHPFGWIVHLSGWKTVLESSFPHMKGHYFALTTGVDGEIRAALPVFEVNSWLLGRRLVSIPFATLCEPLVNQAEDIEPLIEETIELSHRLGSKFIEIRTLHSSPLIKDQRLTESRLFNNHYINLDRPLEDIKKSFHRQSIRHKIKRAENSMLTLRVADTEFDLRVFYHLYTKTRKRLGLPAQPYGFFQSLWDVFHSKKQIRLLVAEQDGSAIAGMIIFSFNGRFSTEYLGSNLDYRDSSPDHFLYWQAIQMAHQDGFKVFDLGRTEASNDTLMLFKSRWGTKVIDLPHYYYPPNTVDQTSDKEASFRYKFLRTLCRSSPEILFPYIGKFCYRHLG
jgi:hypothetical protein